MLDRVATKLNLNYGILAKGDAITINKKLKYFYLKKKLFLYKKIKYLDWTVSYQKKEYKTRLFVTRQHFHMLNTYTPQPTNTLQLKKPTVRLTNDTVAA